MAHAGRGLRGAQAAGDPAEWAALFQIASILLNLDETITRN